MPTPQSFSLDAQQLQPLAGGRALADWVKAGGQPQRRVPMQALRQWWQAVWFEQNWRTQSARLGALSAPPDPVFIVGLWRSGTTALHELLSAATHWSTPRTWQCFSPATCFLTAPPATQAIAERPMDQGHISTHGPQEDEFALLLLGEPSIYRGFLDPRRLRESGRQAWEASVRTQTHAGAAAAALPRWQAFVRGVAAQSPPARLLLKSPNHSFRLPLLQSLYPRARFVWMGRHTGEVLASNQKMWRAMMQLYALWGCPAGELEGFLQDMLLACCAVLERCLQELPVERLLWVPFEALRADPRGTLERILEFLGTASSAGGVASDTESGTVAQRRERIEQALARVPIHPGTRCALPDSPAVQQLERLARAAQQRFGGGGSVAPQSLAL